MTERTQNFAVLLGLCVRRRVDELVEALLAPVAGWFSSVRMLAHSGRWGPKSISQFRLSLFEP